MTRRASWLSELRTPAGRQALAGIVGPAVVVAIVAAATLWSGHVAVEQDGWVVHTQQVALRLADLLQRMTDAETGQRGYIITGLDPYLGPLQGAARDVRQELTELRMLTRDNPVQTRRLDALDRVIAHKFSELDGVIAERRIRGPAAAAALMSTDRGLRLMDSVRAITGAMNAEEARLLVLRRATTARQHLLTEVILLVGAALAAIIGILVNALVSSQRRELAEQNAQLSEQALELELQNQQLQEQAQELEQQASQVNDQAVGLEAANEELQTTNEALSTSNLHLEAATAAATEAHQAADRARTDAEAANAAKSTFLATMSHELRTPLNAIDGYVDLLLAGIRGPVSEQQAADLGRIRRASAHLLGLINDVLNFAKLETGQVAFSHDVVPVQETLSGAATMIEPQAAAKGIGFSRVPVDTSLAVRGDRDKVLQIVLNLLANAVKFTAEGGTVTLSCARAPNDGMIDIVVRDTGRGMSIEQMARIFEPFVQVGRRLSGADAGAGLGLAISRELARGMGGDITVSSSEGRGSTFTVTLPGVRDST